MKATNFTTDRAKMLNNISSFEVNMLRSPAFQEGFTVGFALHDLENRDGHGAKKTVAGVPEEAAYDDEF